MSDEELKPVPSEPPPTNPIGPEIFMKRWQMDPEAAKRMAELMKPEAASGWRRKIIEDFTRRAVDAGNFEKLGFESIGDILEQTGGIVEQAKWRIPEAEQGGIKGFFRRKGSEIKYRVLGEGYKLASIGHGLLAAFEAAAIVTSAEANHDKLVEERKHIARSAANHADKAVRLREKSDMLKFAAKAIKPKIPPLRPPK